MDHVRQRLNEIRQKQLRLQENAQDTRPSTPTNDKSQYIVALGGVAAGLTIALMVWLANAILTTDDVDVIAPESHVAIHTSEIRETNDHIVQLNEHVESLTQSVSSLEIRVKRMMELTNPINDIEMKHTRSSQQGIPESAADNSTFDIKEPYGSSVVDPAMETVKTFAPTHTVNARVNLRPSISLDSTPITTLKVGTEVEYIREDEGWYYVNTKHHGEGWCASDYLAPVLPTQQDASGN